MSNSKHTNFHVNKHKRTRLLRTIIKTCTITFLKLFNKGFCYSRIGLSTVFLSVFLCFHLSNNGRIEKTYIISKKLIILQPRKSPNDPPILPDINNRKQFLKNTSFFIYFENITQKIVKRHQWSFFEIDNVSSFKVKMYRCCLFCSTQNRMFIRFQSIYKLIYYDLSFVESAAQFLKNSPLSYSYLISIQDGKHSQLSIFIDVFNCPLKIA